MTPSEIHLFLNDILDKECPTSEIYFKTFKTLNYISGLELKVHYFESAFLEKKTKVRCA